MVTLETACGVIELGDVLGKGELGVVHTGVQRKTGRRVAVKLIRARADDETVVRFFSDARAVNQIRHPHVAELLATGRTADGRTYAVSEHPEGRPLSTLLVHQYRVSVQTALQWTMQILGALDAAHAAGVLHRGIKPSNLYVVEPPRRTPFIKVLDFGVARLSKRPTAYQAPEQFGAKSVSYSADLYALGCVMYELICGRAPYASDDVARRTVPVLSQVLPGIPRALEQYVEWLMQRMPMSRPQTAEVALEHAVALQEIFPRKRSTPTPLPVLVQNDRTYVMTRAERAHQVHVPAQPPMSVEAAESQVTIIHKSPSPLPLDVQDDDDESAGYEPTYLRPGLAADAPVYEREDVPTQPGLPRAYVPPTVEAPPRAHAPEAKPTLLSRAQSRPDVRALFEDVAAVKAQETQVRPSRPAAQQLADELFGDIEGDDEVQVEDEPQEEDVALDDDGEPSLREREEALLEGGAPPVTLRVEKPAQRAAAKPRRRWGLRALAALMVLAAAGAGAWTFAPPELKEQATERAHTLIAELRGRLGQS